MKMNIKKPFVVLEKCKIISILKMNSYNMIINLLFIYFVLFRLEGYDYDRMFPVYGFGAKFNKELSHAHPLNNNKEKVREL